MTKATRKTFSVEFGRTGITGIDLQRMREEQTLCPSNEYHNDGTGSPETNIYLSALM